MDSQTIHADMPIGSGGACRGDCADSGEDSASLVLVGSPNVGKSIIFGDLTGKYVVVSNYPGTTVEVTKGKGRVGGKDYHVLDTPGMYSLLPITEEERVARSVLLNENPHVVLQVADAKNMERMLHVTLQLIEANLPVILDLNLMDEAQRLGMSIDTESLEKELGVPVVATVATEGQGMDALRDRIGRYVPRPGSAVHYDQELGLAVQKIEDLIPGDYNIAKRAVALLLLQEDPEIRELVKDRMSGDFNQVESVVKEVRESYNQPLRYIITLARQKTVRGIVERTTKTTSSRRPRLREGLSRLMMHPLAGIPILLAIVYGFYEFVGVFGAQTAVDFLENKVFGQHINPVVTRLVSSIIPWKVVQDLFVHDYGIITLGVRYAIAIILPIVTTFFIAFSVIEDTGYLPRLAMLIDRLFKKIGLNGRAVIPMVLGFGCDTMATIVTKTLETRRERTIATFLLSLAIPCSAQMGVILALLAGNAQALWIFLAVMSGNFLLIGFLTAKLMPGESPLFYMEVPPLRWPKLSNVVTKTYTRVEWYLKEVLPLFIVASVLIWAGKLSGVFTVLTNILSYPVRWIGLPKEAATAFLFGFFRRDYGAAGLYDLKKAGMLHGIPLVVSVITLALFMPCIAQFSITIKERGLKTALAMAGFIFVYAFMIGWLTNTVMNALRVVI